MLNETFSIVDDVLIRHVVPKRGTPYDHTCDMDMYETVAHAIDEFGSTSFTLADLHKAIDAPWTQAAVALAFMKERGCVVPTIRKKHVGATSAVHADAMLEWYALREQAPGAIGGPAAS